MHGYSEKSFLCTFEGCERGQPGNGFHRHWNLCNHMKARGIDPSRDTVARWLAIHPNGRSYGTNLGYLRSEGYLENFTLTDKGKELATIVWDEAAQATKVKSRSTAQEEQRQMAG